jgi:imidazole glycerol-phosphate synthase subunit HisH
MSKTVIVNYGMGNLNSVHKKVNKISGNAIISSNPEEILEASKLILPGVGHFAKAVQNLNELKLWDTLNEAVLVRQIPILGICLGMQLMTKKSEEGNIEGFGWFNAEVVHFKVNDKLKHKVPHMGWNSIRPAKPSGLLSGLQHDPELYFVHSYHVVSYNTEEVMAVTNYEYDFVSGLEKGNIFGLQFHPEKSHDVGEQILENFLKL